MASAAHHCVWTMISRKDGEPKERSCIKSRRDPSQNHVQNLNNDGDVARRSPLMALTRTNPVFSTRAHMPEAGRLLPRPQADVMRAMPTMTQYAMARPTVAQRMMRTLPYGECSGPGSSGVVATVRQRISFPNGSRARSSVLRVVK